MGKTLARLRAVGKEAVEKIWRLMIVKASWAVASYAEALRLRGELNLPPDVVGVEAIR